MSPSRSNKEGTVAAAAVADALKADQVSFTKHLKELTRMLKDIETKLKPTIEK